ncbi:unnamed protein product [Closterium sp. NIES-54]
MVHQVLQRFGFQFSSPQPTPLSTSHSLSAPPSDKSVEQSGPYPELVGCLMYLMTCTRPDLAYHLSLLTRYVAPSRHRKELRWLTYVLADLGEQPRSPPLMFVDNKAMIALCQEHKLEHSTKHIDLRYFLARELQQRGQLHLAYMATRANTADVFTKALPPGLGIVPNSLLVHSFLLIILTLSPRQQQQRRSETHSPQQLREWLFKRGTSGGSDSCPYVIRTGVCAGQTCGKLNTQHRCFSCLDDAWRAEFGDDVELRRWAQLLQSGVAIFDLDYDVIISAIYALSFSAEGDCERNVPLDPGMASAALGASESGTLPADPSGGPVAARSSTFLPCPAVPCGSRSGLHLPSLVSTAALKDAMVTTTTSGATPAQVSASRQVAASCSCRLLWHQTLLWHHRLGHPSLPRLCGMHSRLLVSGLPRSLPPLPPSPAPPCLPCVEGRQRAAPYSSSFPPTTAPLQTLHMDMWGPACVSGQDLPVLRLHSDRGGEFSSDLLRDFCRGEGILQSFMLPDSPQQNGISERRIGLVMEYAAHQLNLWPCVSLPETLPTLRWTGEVGDVSVFRVWGSPAFVRDTSADKLSARAIPFVFLGFVPEAPGWQFYHPTSRRVLPSLDVTFEESVPLYHLFPYRSAPPPSLPLSLALGPPPVDPLLPQGPTPSCVSQVDPLPGTAHVEVAVGSGSARGATSGGVASGGAQPGGVESEGAKTGGV